jgi:hypothetical protein
VYSSSVALDKGGRAETVFSTRKISFDSTRGSSIYSFNVSSPYCFDIEVRQPSSPDSSSVLDIYSASVQAKTSPTLPFSHFCLKALD